jgi:hypothetical protein
LTLVEETKNYFKNIKGVVLMGYFFLMKKGNLEKGYQVGCLQKIGQT